MEKDTLMHASEIELKGTMCTVIIEYCQELRKGFFFFFKKKIMKQFFFFNIGLSWGLI